MLVHQYNNGQNTFRDAVLELVWPTRCSGCERPGELLCDTCRAALLPIALRYACPDCGAPFGYQVCTECYSREGKEQHEFSAAVCALELGEISGRIIVLYKDYNEHRLSAILSEYLCLALPSSWFAWADVLTWIPSDKKAFKRRGFDHMQRMAQHAALILDLPVQPLLDKAPCADQRGLNRDQRSRNLQESFSIPDEADRIPPHVLLIDDVFTTGSTLDAATIKLKEGGASEVRVACVARAW